MASSLMKSRMNSGGKPNRPSGGNRGIVQDVRDSRGVYNASKLAAAARKSGYLGR